MNNTKTDVWYVDKIIKNINFIIIHTENITMKDLSSDEVLQDSMMFRLVQISENSRKLTPEFKEKNSSVPWGDIAGLRNRIVHDYGNVDISVIFDTLKNDIPYLRDIFTSI